MNGPRDNSHPGPLTAEELAAHKERLAGMNRDELVRSYENCLFMCQLQFGRPARAAFVQQFVATWKELRKRDGVKD